ncbi:MAG: fatty acyl-AMP ligase, partial [Thermoanaerobaculia bacterium]
MRLRAEEAPGRRIYTFLRDGEEESASLTLAELDMGARAVAAWLQGSEMRGERALLLFPPGLPFITAFFGCLYAGAIAVPAYPPSPSRTQPRLRAVARDARPRVVLTTSALLQRAEALAVQAPELAEARWLAVDGPEAVAAGAWRPPDLGSDAVAFLQYTSGSTSSPKGVVVTHGNLLHNQEMIRRAFGQDAESTIASWLPMYHDMGLIGGVLHPLYLGASCVLMSPLSFLQRPSRWLRMVSRYGATASGGPNFAYELCLHRIGPEERAELDLGSWRVAFNGAEPVRAETLERFAAAFAGCGFRRVSFSPCYGLAEATLFVAGGGQGTPPRLYDADAGELERGSLQPAMTAAVGAARRLVSCGSAWLGQEAIVVDPESRRRCAPGRVGEIWVSGPSVAQGYWNRPEETARTFGARLADEPEAGPYLATGDLGCLLEGELYVTGRIKDLIILRGRNLYPQDLELTVESGSPELRPGGAAAFTVEVEGEERLVVVAEVQRGVRPDAAALGAAVRHRLSDEHGVDLLELVLLAPGHLPKTSSGKVMRHACRAAYLSGEIAALGRSSDAGPRPGSAAVPAVDREA